MDLKRQQQANKNSEYTGAQNKLSKILLNGNNICMVRTGAALCGTRTDECCSSFLEACLKANEGIDTKRSITNLISGGFEVLDSSSDYSEDF